MGRAEGAAHGHDGRAVRPALVCFAHPPSFPLWDVHVAVDEGTRVEYKYIIVAPNGDRLRLVRWESFERNREVTATGVKLAVHDGDFGQSTKHISEGVDHGWIDGEWQLRLFFGCATRTHPRAPPLIP